ncbi:MAG: ABC transporter permease, partial [Eubacteriales bacterium]|nr:ABC transporter permease [Eubacteriales bacterium]
MDKKNLIHREGVAGYIFISPFVFGFLVFTLIPIVASFALSFTDYDILSAPKFVGLANYSKMFTSDAKFVKALKVTFFYAAVSVPLRLVMALAVALILKR